MGAVTVTPEKFAFVEFTTDEIVSATEQVRSRVGMSDHDVSIDVNEESPLGRVELTSLDPISLSVEGGAFEDPKKPRHLSPVQTQLAVGMRLLQAGDRLDPGFGAPALDQPQPTRLQSAWDIFAVARLARAGQPVHEPRWRYHWRNRHGFTDLADREFDRVWTAESLTWADLVEASDTALSTDT